MLKYSTTKHFSFAKSSGRAGGIVVQGQIYMDAPIGGVEIYLQLKIVTPVKVPNRAATPLTPSLLHHWLNL